MVSPGLLKMLKNTAGLTAAVFAATAATAAGVPIALLSLGYAAALLVGQAWIEAHGEKSLEGVRDDLKTLLDKHDDLSSLVEALAQEIETHRHIEPERAQEVHALLTAGEQELAAIAADNTALIRYSTEWLGARLEEYGDNFERALDSLAEYLRQEFDRLHERHDDTQARLAGIEDIVTDIQRRGVAGGEDTIGRSLRQLAVLHAACLDTRIKADSDFVRQATELSDKLGRVVKFAARKMYLDGLAYLAEDRVEDAVGSFQKACCLDPEDDLAREALMNAIRHCERQNREERDRW